MEANETALTYLNQNKLLYLNMLEVLRRGSAELLYAGEDGVLLYDRGAGAHMLSARNRGALEKFLPFLEGSDIVVGHEDWYRDELAERLGMWQETPCYQAAWLAGEPPELPPFDGELRPILTPSRVTLSDLKGYESEKAEVRDNFENFVSGLPYSDMLLYGDRGTGKSSTVHAMVNAFAEKKLRLVEIDKENILALPRLRAMLSAEPMKFVVFIDDFSLREEDDRVSTLKAALQGSMEGHAGNVMIVATSNRRHIVEENFSSRMNSVHAGDSEEELLSLSDRFGITVLFSTTGKQEYLAIVRALAADAGLKTDGEELSLLAERWALVRGGRSPRRARQFVDYLYACERKGKKAEV